MKVCSISEGIVNMKLRFLIFIHPMFVSTLLLCVIGEVHNIWSDAVANYLDGVPHCISPIMSDNGRNGTFTSARYPSHYPNRTHCRYDFIGHPNERVQIVFTDFNLYHPETVYLDKPRDREYRDRKEKEREEERRKEKEKDCGGADVLSAFVYGSDGKLARVDDYCGSNTPLAVMSSGNRLTLEFHAPTSSQYVRGFSALYSFVTDFGIKTGRKNHNVTCGFVYNSTETSNGTFTSPNYPGVYPRDTECSYLFYGQTNEHVELHFTYFHIDGIQPCDEESHSDYVEFSNYMPIDRKYDRKCGTDAGFKVRSDRKFFRVKFRSNDRYDATGFHATYQFSDKTNQLTIRNVRSLSSVSLSGSEVIVALVMIWKTFLSFYY